MSKITVQPLGYALGAEITGIDLARPVSDEHFRQITEAWHKHLVLCFPQQNLGLTEQIDFCARFGKLERENNVDGVRHPDFPEIYMVVNQPVEIKGKRISASKADQWHWDGAYFEAPPLATFLLSQELPRVGGDTMFANMQIAYEMLSPKFKTLIDSLYAVHDRSISRNNFAPGSPEALELQRTPAVVHAVVGVHPVTGHKSLLLGDRIRNLVGMTEEETRPLISFLNEHATRYEFSYRHRWKVHDLLLWDNRAVQHRMLTDYEPGQARRMHRCVVLGPKTGQIYVEPALTDVVPALS